jgi:ribonucleotide monophosphatase NagD (HAD superfamily)
MVGDNLQTDIMFGQNSGVDTLLVLSGCTQEGKLDNLDLTIEGKPTHVQPFLNYSKE